MNPFGYHRPASVAAAEGLRRERVEASYIAGGQSLLGAMKLGLAAPSDVIDLSQVTGLAGITLEGNSLRIGAMSPHAAVAASAEVQRLIPALARLADDIGDPAVRTRGTLGGSLANNDPAACWPAAVLGLGATVHTSQRSIDGDKFFLGLYETALHPGELITAVSFPVPKRAAYVKFKQPASRFALVGVFVSQGPQGVRVAVTGAGACAFRATTLEAALAKSWSAQSLDALSASAEGLNSDLHASAAYVKFKQPASRFALVGVFISQGPQGVRVAVTGAGACAFRATALEAALARSWSAESLDALSVSAEGLNSDLHASAAYRAHLIGVLARRAVAACG